MTPSLIAVDWGSTSLRAYRLSASGEALEAIAAADGISTVARGAFPATLKRLIGAWLEPGRDLPIVASGMVGSRNGWLEAPYLACPAGLDELAARLTTTPFEGRTVHIVPGLSHGFDGDDPDVMRGEEVEILGLGESGARLVVLPGSHSKWAAVDRGRVDRFKTFPTGELFAAIKDRTLVGAFARAAPERPPGAAFARGVRRAAEAGVGLIGALFGARSLPLAGRLAEEDAANYLSGLLIGAEIAAARRLFPDQEATVAGAAALVARYLAAFAALGDRARPTPPGAAARGLYLVARAGGLI